MSTQYEFMKRQVVEEVAALQEKLIGNPGGLHQPD